MKKLLARLFALAVLTLIAGSLHAQTLSVLYNFGTTANDPTSFLSPGTLAQGADGNIYTTSQSGGIFSPDYFREGTVFSMSATGALSLTYTFEAGPVLVPNGGSPYSGLTLGTDGDFYGTTPGGGVIDGANAFGTVFKIDPQGNLTTLYVFTGGRDGANPFAAPVEGTDGNFYGTTTCGGIQTCTGGEAGGTVYQLTPTGSLTTLYRFDCSVGCSSYAPLVQGTSGDFYGTTTFGGIDNNGSIFKISSLEVFKTLYQFDGTHGASPLAPLIQASNGDFYGTTELGGANAYGAVFKMTPAGKLTVLHSFAGNGTDGCHPVAGLVQATDGNLYGVTECGGTYAYGTIFSISPTGAAYSTLYSFDGTTGLIPEVTLLQHTNGLLYGLTNGGGPFDFGVFYSFDVVGLKPSVKLIPTTGGVGAPVGVFGQGFTGATKVSFAGVAATFTVVSDTYLTTTVPSGAKTGVVTVKTPTGTLKSNPKFRVLP